MKFLIRILVLFLLIVNTAFSQELTAEQITQKINDAMSVEQVYGIFKMTITTSSGKERTFEYESFSKDKGKKNLIRYLKPARVKGQAILMLNNADDIWTYFPRTKRTRKLATHAKKQKIEGSDFSYEDMGAGESFITDYTSKRLKNEKKEGYDCYKLELTRKKDSDAGYSKMLIWARKDNFMPVVIDYYDDKHADVLEKELVLMDFRVIQGIPTAMKMVMYDKQDKTRTTMEYEKIDYNVNLDDEMFTERALRK